MFDFNKINSLTNDDIIIINKLLRISDEAKRISELIRDHFRCFSWGQTKVAVYNDEILRKTEYLTYDGIWIAAYPNLYLEVDCSEEGLYEVFKADYLLSHGFVHEGDEGVDEAFLQKAMSAKYFKVFVDRITSDIASEVTLK